MSSAEVDFTGAPYFPRFSVPAQIEEYTLVYAYNYSANETWWSNDRVRYFQLLLLKHGSQLDGVS